MKKNYKALGGLFEVKIDISSDSDKLSEFELEDMKEEVKRLQNIINTNSPENKEAKPHKSLKDILGDDSIPYEVRMKYIIEAYKKEQEKWAKLYDYSKHLEKEVIRLKTIFVANGYTEKIEGIEIKSPGQLIDKLYKKIRALKDEKRNLETKIRVEFPDRRFDFMNCKKIIKDQDSYIKNLQKLLNENNIPYDSKEPTNSLEIELLGK